jgi:hypothetical protein
VAETNLNGRVMAALKPWDPRRVENAVDPGSPDIEYIGGHIEDKHVRSWPKRADTPLRVPHYVPGQRAWHRRRRLAGGRVHVVIEVAGEVFVFDAALAAEGLGSWTREEMSKHALLHMPVFNQDRFRDFIRTCNADRAGGRNG